LCSPAYNLLKGGATWSIHSNLACIVPEKNIFL
jgi:hypothetical protein